MCMLHTMSKTGIENLMSRDSICQESNYNYCRVVYNNNIYLKSNIPTKLWKEDLFKKKFSKTKLK